ncbi:DUF2254 domain-containing protein [Mangrovimonas aestuarii]|uniref:DUF2254 domain-containing protein n=1 Tax=Mangrovimonas aestuarii TaxID=3018443 RepID=UPI0023793765|nr:DUF2254 domain-containing protein [Mangrovimonas aestuarii]
MKKSLFIYFHKLREQLWFRPLLFCLISISGALFAQQADGTKLDKIVPSIKKESIEGLLDTISASMLVISIFAVGSMLSALSSASRTATPRSFHIVVTDDMSQNALSVFIGSFIFSIVATLALDNGFYGKSGIFILFLFTLSLFVLIILTFLQWVNRISRLGRLEHTISQVESVTAKSLANYIKQPFLNALPITTPLSDAQIVFSNTVGYVQHVDIAALQTLAKENGLKIQLNCLPGDFIHENFAIISFTNIEGPELDTIKKKMNDAIHIGNTRWFDEDPRFGFIALTEIASKALSPGINDPGTAIQIIGSHERLFFLWNQFNQNNNENSIIYDCITVPKISMIDFFDDAFRPISRDGANNIEVMLRLQKVFKSIETINHENIKTLATQYSREAYNRAEQSMKFKPDLDKLRKECLFYH